MIGASDSLQQPRCAFWRADIDDEIDVAPIHSKVERRGAHDGTQASARHRRFDFAALRHVERAVMKRNRKIVVVEMPQVLKNALGLAARVDEDKRGAVRPDHLVKLAERVTRRMAGPRHSLFAVQDRHLRRRAARRHD